MIKFDKFDQLKETICKRINKISYENEGIVEGILKVKYSLFLDIDFEKNLRDFFFNQ